MTPAVADLLCRATLSAAYKVAPPDRNATLAEAERLARIAAGDGSESTLIQLASVVLCRFALGVGSGPAAGAALTEGLALIDRLLASGTPAIIEGLAPFAEFIPDLRSEARALLAAHDGDDDGCAR